jgi:hypothetical protein
MDVEQNNSRKKKKKETEKEEEEEEKEKEEEEKEEEKEEIDIEKDEEEVDEKDVKATSSKKESLEGMHANYKELMTIQSKILENMTNLETSLSNADDLLSIMSKKVKIT